MLKNLEDLFLKAVRYEEFTSELDFVLNFYKDDCSFKSQASVGTTDYLFQFM